MQLVIQRVKEASVTKVDTGEVVGKITVGLFILIGVKTGDSRVTAESMADKVFKLRIMRDKDGKMNLSVKDVNGEFLVVSQFTLNADTSGGNRPSFVNAAKPDEAKEIYEYFLKILKEKGVTVETGSFGDYMEIKTLLDGPVTITLSS